MSRADSRAGRRAFLSTLGIGAAAFAAHGAFAEELTRTPSQTQGPFYPDKLPLDTDNDLLVINDAITPAVGEVTHLSGRILDAKGDPVRNALVEIWQVDGTGSTSTPRTVEGRSPTRISRVTAASSPGRRANTTSARSSPSRIPAGRPTSTCRSREGGTSC